MRGMREGDDMTRLIVVSGCVSEDYRDFTVCPFRQDEHSTCEHPDAPECTPNNLESSVADVPDGHAPTWCPLRSDVVEIRAVEGMPAL